MMYKKCPNEYGEVLRGRIHHGEFVEWEFSAGGKGGGGSPSTEKINMKYWHHFHCELFIYSGKIYLQYDCNIAIYYKKDPTKSWVYIETGIYLL